MTASVLKTRFKHIFLKVKKNAIYSDKNTIGKVRGAGEGGGGGGRLFSSYKTTLKQQLHGAK